VGIATDFAGVGLVVGHEREPCLNDTS